MRSEMDDTIYEKYKRAGQIASAAREYGIDLIKSGTSYLDVAQNIEAKILESGAGIAFPVNLSVNELAAHYSPRHDDTLIFKKGNIVKLDVGAHVDGYIADTASTLEVGTNNHQDMIKASSEALDNAIELIKADVSLSEIGKVIEKKITSFGFKPIDNLTGHSMEQYELHSGISVPNVSNRYSKAKLKVGDVLAIEPFATNGAGHVVSGKGSNIYLCSKSFRSKIIRDRRTKILFDKMMGRFKTLPFAQRWCKDILPNSDLTLKRLSLLGLIRHYPQLVEAKHGIVTQKEHTVIVKDDGCEVIT